MKSDDRADENLTLTVDEWGRILAFTYPLPVRVCCRGVDHGDKTGVCACPCHVGNKELEIFALTEQGRAVAEGLWAEEMEKAKRGLKLH